MISEVFAYRVQRHLNKKGFKKKVSGFWLSYLDLDQGHTTFCKTQHFTIIIKDFAMIILLLVVETHYGAVLYLFGKYAVYSVICTKITIVNGALSWQNDEKWQSRTGLPAALTAAVGQWKCMVYFEKM